MKYIKDICLCILLFTLLYYSKETLSATKDALTLWFEKLVPSMFVTLVFIRILYHRHLLDHLHIPFVNTIFHIDQGCLSIVLCMMFLGFPNGALFVDEAFSKGMLTKQSAQRLIYTCSFATPGFVIMSCGALIFHSVQVGIQLFLAQILSGLLLLFFTRGKPIISNVSNIKTLSFTKCMSSAIVESGKSLYMMGGYMMLCMTTTSVVLHFLPTSIAFIIRILSEFSSGIILLQSVALPLTTLQILTCMLLSFGGFCVHMQVHSMAEHVCFSYPKYVIYRVLQSSISALIFILFLL